MASSWDEHKAELERLYMNDQPRKTYLQIKTFMAEQRNFHKSLASYERQFKIWGFRRNMKSSQWRDIHCSLVKRKKSGRESGVVLEGISLDLGNQKIKRKLARNASLLSSKATSGSTSAVESKAYIYTPPAKPSTLDWLLKGLPWVNFRVYLSPDTKGYPDLAVIASQMEAESNCRASSTGSVLKAHTMANVVSWTSIFQHPSRKIWDHGDASLVTSTRHYHKYLEALLVPEVHDELSGCEEASSGTVQSINSRYTPYFNLLAYLASNHLLHHEAHNLILDLAEDLILRRQFKPVFSKSGPTIKALLDAILAFAVEARNMSIIKAALSAGAYSGIHVGVEPALIWAARNGHTDVLEELLNTGADSLLLDSNSTYIMGGALEHASMRGDTTAARLLLDAGGSLQSGFALVAAIKRQHLDLVVLLVNNGADVNATPQFTPTALQAAAASNNIAIAKYLLSFGADTNQKVVADEKTALQYASDRNNRELSILLLEAGADINWRAAPRDGRTVLQAAAEHANIDLIELFLNEGADVNALAAPFRGRTALQAAAESGRQEVVRLLLSHGADVNGLAADEHGFTALEAAAKNNHIVMAKLLLDWSADRFDLTEALHVATRNGNLAMVQFLLNAGADISTTSKCGRTIMKSAIVYEEVDSGDVFFEEHFHDGAHETAAIRRFRHEKLKHAWFQRDALFIHKMLDLHTSMGFLPSYNGSELVTVVKKPHDTNIDLMNFLLKSGMRLDAREGHDYQDALCAAVWSHDFPVIQALLKARARANFDIVRRGNIVLDAAILASRAGKAGRFRKIFAACKLFESREDLDGTSPCTISKLDNLEEESDFLAIIPSFLLRFMGLRDPDDSEYTLRAARALSIVNDRWLQHTAEIVQILLKAGADPNNRTKDNHTPLQSAVKMRSTLVVRILLEANADVNASPRENSPDNGDCSSRTALQGAIYAEVQTPLNMDIIHLLLDRGADVNAPAPDNAHMARTALQAAIEIGSFELIQLLLDRGADINAPAGSYAGVTALQAAAMNGYVGLAVQLLEAGADVNAPASLAEGRTAFEGAAERGRLDMVKLLLNAGAGYDEDGQLDYLAAMEYAMKEGHIVVHDLIKDHFNEKFQPDSSNVDEGSTNMEWSIDETRYRSYCDGAGAADMELLFGDQSLYLNSAEWDGQF